MPALILHIKNMVCPRCISAVEKTLQQLGIAYRQVNLGEVELNAPLPKEKEEALEHYLKSLGFELIGKRANVIIDKIKKAVLEYISFSPEEKRGKLSVFIAGKLSYEYTYLSNLFSSIEGITIEQFHILQRIEKAKELLVYDQLSLSEIAYQLGYSSVHHLSTQFKKTTGLTPSHFKKIGAERRKFLDQL